MVALRSIDAKLFLAGVGLEAKRPSTVAGAALAMTIHRVGLIIAMDGTGHAKLPIYPAAIAYATLQAPGTVARTLEGGPEKVKLAQQQFPQLCALPYNGCPLPAQRF